MTPEQWEARYLSEEGSNYSHEVRLEFVKDYLLDPNLAAVSRKHGVPYATAISWKQKSWWHNMVEEILLNYRDELLAKQRQIINKTYDEIGERLENGDETYIPNEGHVRTKVKANHLATIADVTLKANQLLQGKATSINHVTVEQLADKLRTITQEAIDITPTTETTQQVIQTNQIAE
jgi:vacuolar-type H+-ATPase subunit E/Vma4